MLNYALYGVLGSIGTVFAFSIDTIMVAPLTNYDEGGLYSIALFIGNAIAIPLAAINGIAAPIISNAWGKGDRAEIVKIYNRSSVLLFTAGVFLLALVWLSLGDVFRLSSKYEELILGQYVVLIIGLARVIDMTTGVNGSIIGYSRYYRFNLLALLVLSFGNVLMNYLLIPKYGITGAAIATAISIALFNIIKFVFIWLVFKMQPIRLTFLWVFLLAVVAYIVSSLLPSTGIPLINILIRSGMCVLLFAGPLLYLKLVPDINEFVLEAWKKIKKS
jgi:O-antigen/teichoic acid export membrane protein